MLQKLCVNLLKETLMITNTALLHLQKLLNIYANKKDTYTTKKKKKKRSKGRVYKECLCIYVSIHLYIKEFGIIIIKAL